MNAVVEGIKRLLGESDDFADGGPNPRRRRGEERKRVRFCTAKALDRSGKFLCDCFIFDRSPNGLRLRLARDIMLDERFALFDDQTREILGVEIAWRNKVDLGVRIKRKKIRACAKQADQFGLSARYYAVPD